MEVLSVNNESQESKGKTVALARPHAVTLENRQRALLSGVTDVLSFNEQEVMLSTTGGDITLIGDALHIANLNLEEGQLLVEGEIAGIEYAEIHPAHAKSGGGLFSRLFR